MKTISLSHVDTYLNVSTD